jgi:hypothetical protein
VGTPWSQSKDWGEHQRLTETQRPMFRTGKEIKARLYGTEESALRAASSQPSDHEVKCSRSACRHFKREVDAHGRRR